MKKTILFSLLALAVTFSFNADAFAKKKKKKKEKVSKKEKAVIKAWGKKKKKMDPLKYKEMYEEYQMLKGEISGLKRQAETLNSDVMKSKGKVSEINSMIAKAKSESEQADKKMQKNASKSNQNNFEKGTVIKVQVGDIGGYSAPDIQNLETDKADGSRKYTLGYFRVNNPDDSDEWSQVQEEANRLVEYLKKMGVKEVATVVYKDNVRANSVDIENNSND